MSAAVMDHPATEPRTGTAGGAAKVAVVIPCYRVRRHILGVLERIGPECAAIYVVDDRCPEGSGALVRDSVRDPRVTVLFHAENQGVGGATLTGMLRAAHDGATAVVKIDGDGQMDPALIPRFVRPLLEGEADYTKGNRFYDLDTVRAMPAVRLAGNAALSFLSKLSGGYWDLFDPTNGYVAIHANVLAGLPHGKIARRYFFESDMLFRLYLMRAVVIDVPMHAVYGDEISGLKVGREAFSFLVRHLRNAAKRVVYSYFLRDFSIASLYLLVALPALAFGTIFGSLEWYHLAREGIPASAGTVMLAGLPVILGFQSLLAFLALDIGNVPRRPIARRLEPPEPRPIQPPAAAAP